MAVLLRVLLIITGLTGIHSITTVRRVSVKAGDSISIPCLYASQYLNHVKYLCKGYYWLSCTIVIKTNQQNSTTEKYSISDDKSQRIFNVTINDLMDEDTYYWCAVEINDGADDGVRFRLSGTTGTPKLYVDKQQITGFKGDDITIDCNYRNGGETKWCRLNSSCVTPPSGSINGTGVTIDESVSNVFTVTMSGLNTESIGWYWCVKGHFQMPVYVTVDELTTTTTAMSSTTAIIRSDSTQTLPTTTQLSSPLTSEEPHTAQPTNSTNGKGGESSTMVAVLTSTLVPLLLLIPAAFVAWRLIGRNKTKPEGSDFAADSQNGSVPDVLYTTVVHNQHAAAQQKTEPVDGSVIYSILLPQNMGQLAEKK